MHIFGLTGGIGSGKSTVARRFRERRLPVIDADELSRAVVAKGTEGLGDVIRRFGRDVLDAAGHLDRKKLAGIVFGDDDARRDLNTIVHPRVAALVSERAAEFAAAGEPLACYEVPLLFEGRIQALVRPVVVVVVPLEVQVARTMARDGATREEAAARVRAQMPLTEKAALADHVIDNTGTVEATRARADAVLDAICQTLGLDPARYPKTD